MNTDFYVNWIVRIVVILYAFWIGGLATTVYNRIPNGISMGPSEKPRCNKCGHIIKFKYFIPVFGYIFSRGKCVNCGIPIPKIYLAIEISIASYILALSTTTQIFNEAFIARSLYGAFLITIMFIYYSHKNIKSHIVWILSSFIAIEHGYNNTLPDALMIFESTFMAYASMKIFTKKLTISMTEFIMCVMLIASMTCDVSIIFLAFACIYWFINFSKYSKNIHSKLKENIINNNNLIFIILATALIRTFIA